jgi:hypothetical protein
MHEYKIIAHIRPINHDRFIQHNGMDKLVEDIECLAPYLSKDREVFCASDRSFHMMKANMSSSANVHSASIVCVMECDPIDEEDMLILLDMIASKHTDIHSVDVKITGEVQ